MNLGMSLWSKFGGGWMAWEVDHLIILKRSLSAELLPME